MSYPSNVNYEKIFTKRRRFLFLIWINLLYQNVSIWTHDWNGEIFLVHCVLDRIVGQFGRHSVDAVNNLCIKSNIKIIYELIINLRVAFNNSAKTNSSSARSRAPCQVWQMDRWCERRCRMCTGPCFDRDNSRSSDICRWACWIWTTQDNMMRTLAVNSTPMSRICPSLCFDRSSSRLSSWIALFFFTIYRYLF